MKQPTTIKNLFAQGKLSHLQENQPSSSFRQELQDKLMKTYLQTKGGFFMSFIEKLQLRPIQFALIVSLILLVSGSISIVTQLFRDKPQFQNKLKANLIFAEGTVLAKTPTDDRWVEAKTNDVLTENYSLKTGENSKAILELDDGGAIRLQENTEIALSSLAPTQIIITEESGNSYHRVAKSKTRQYTVKAGEVEATAQGTAYTVGRKEKMVTVNVIDSKVKLNKNNTQLNEGQKAIFHGETDKLEIESIAKNEVENDLFLAWNKTQDELKGEDTGILGDNTPPSIVITFPEDGLSTKSETITIKGSTEQEAKILVNGEKTENKEGLFEKEVPLILGPNTLTITVTDSAQNSSEKQLKVTCQEEEQKQEQEEKQQENDDDSEENNDQNGSISLSGSVNSNGIHLTWTVSNLDASHGFKIVKAQNSTPSYPGSDYQYVNSEDQDNKYSYLWAIKDGKTYNLRVCRYQSNNTCDVYSNMITVTTVKEETPDSQVSSIILSGTDEHLSWIVTGSSPLGYKVVWSKNPNPTYPTREGDKYHYLSNPIVTTDEIDGFAGDGKYYVRVCEYLGGKCGTYSNQIQVNL